MCGWKTCARVCPIYSALAGCVWGRPVEFGKAVELGEKYLREFVLYIVFFFRGRESVEEEDVLALSDMNRSILFAILSVILSAYLWDILVIAKADFDDDVIRVIATSLMRWLSLGVLLYSLMRMFGVRVHALIPILSVFRVFSISRLVGVFSAYVMSGLLSVANAEKIIGEGAIAGPFVTAYVVQIAIVIFYFWRETADYGDLDGPNWRRTLATLLFVIIATIVVMIPLAEYLMNYLLVPKE